MVELESDKKIARNMDNTNACLLTTQLPNKENGGLAYFYSNPVNRRRDCERGVI
jgi:hypothetical protein